MTLRIQIRDFIIIRMGIWTDMIKSDAQDKSIDKN